MKKTKANRNPRGRPRVEVVVSDPSGDLTLVFFNQLWREEQLSLGSQVLVWGKLTEYRGKRQMAHPIVDLVARVESGAAESRMLQVIPVYPASAKAGLTSWEIGTYVKEALLRAGPLARCPSSGAGASSSMGAPMPCGRSTNPRRGPSRGPPATGWSSTSCCACS